MTKLSNWERSTNLNTGVQTLATCMILLVSGQSSIGSTLDRQYPISRKDSRWGIWASAAGGDLSLKSGKTLLLYLIELQPEVTPNVPLVPVPDQP